MKILVLDGSSKDDKVMCLVLQIVKKYFEQTDHDIRIFTIRNLRLAPSCGSFYCWLRTPGICIINDIGREIARHAANSDCWIFLTPVTFGGYSSNLKKAIDRMAPLMLPYFLKNRGEVHHVMRYKKRSELMVFGSSNNHDLEMEAIFDSLVQRNRLNFNNIKASSKVFMRTDSVDIIKKEVDEKLLNLLTKRHE